MKRLFVTLLIVICCQVQAQDYFSGEYGILKIGGGYATDFPGLNGYGIIGEYTHSLSERFEGGFGIKRLNMNGYPRTSTVKEYTKATTLDFNIYFLPVANEKNILRIGAGYSFSFFKTRRSYPIIETHGIERITSWPIQDAKGRSSGVTLTGEYEHIFAANFSIGLKASLCKAYNRDFYIGPYIGVRL